MSPVPRRERVLQNTVEVVTEAELGALLEGGGKPRAYIGLEPSGFLHLGTGPMVADKMKDLVEAGFDMTVLLADWHAYINDKFGGDWEAIRRCASYFVEAYGALGVPDSVRFVYASDLVQEEGYWRNVLRVAKASTLARIRRALDIMGRKEEEADLDASKLFYPAMQVTDIHTLDLDLAYGGMDQRHAHMLYREVAPKLGWKQVVALHTPLLTGLQGGGRMDSWDSKMSKSRPETSIFIHDTPETIAEKVDRAYGPPREVQGNPLLEFYRFLLFPRSAPLTVEREDRHGGDVTYEAYSALEADYRKGDLHPKDLKAAAARHLTQLLEPARSYFERHPEGLRKVQELVDA
ncbi:MAG: tyrosine--tRNA ligase [Candidatus Thermoplasmatota archaeon]|nr:tyrosine--tRNA ligase [Candidatus Thermoplasmatota archaeon]